MHQPTFPDRFNIADRCLFDRLTEGLGDKTALLFGDQSHTYEEVAARARALRAHLAMEDVAIEQRVLLLLHDSPALVWALFAALHHGAVVAMGNPDAPASELAELIEYTRPAVVFTIPRVAGSLAPSLSAADIRNIVLAPEVPTGGDLEAAVDIPFPLAQLRVIPLRDALAQGRAALTPRTMRTAIEGPRPTRRDDVALWTFTSTSTGERRAAVHAHRDIAYSAELYAKSTLGYRRDDVTLAVPRLFFAYAAGANLLFPFSVGATAGLFVERPTPESIAHYTQRYRPTIVANVPSMMSKLLALDDARAASGKPGLDLSSVRFHLSAGEALPPALLERFRGRFHADVYDGIGSAEMFHIYCTNRPGDMRPGSLGRPVDGYTIRVLPGEAQSPSEPEVPNGELGEMWVRGDSVALGYFQDRERSWATFFGRWCRTGDLFRRDAEGYLWFKGRAEDLIELEGALVAPFEIEECLTEHPAVELAAVIRAEDDGLPWLKAFVVLSNEALGAATEEGQRALAEELKAFVKSRLGAHRSPRRVAFMADIPGNDRERVDRRALRRREQDGGNPRGL